MKTYFRLLSFAKPLEKFAIPYILTTLLQILFNTLNFALLAPLLEALFLPAKHAATELVRPSGWDIMGLFRYYVGFFTQRYGAWNALMLVCGTLVVSNLLANLFRYFSQRIMENL